MDGMTLSIAGTVRESIVDGPGIRYAVFAQGCPHRCAGCHNSETWAFGGGTPAREEDIIAEMKRNPLLRGITLSGGEPFCQAVPMSHLARLARAAGYDVVVFSGFTFEELMKKKTEPGVRELLHNADILIDGRYDASKRSWSLPFAGSSNQRMIDVQQTRASGTITLWDSCSGSDEAAKAAG